MRIVEPLISDFNDASASLPTRSTISRRALMGATVAAVAGTTLTGRASFAMTTKHRLLVDNMLVRAARMLRAAGHDAIVPASQMSRAKLIQRAVREDRILVSGDDSLSRFDTAQTHLVLVDGTDPADVAASLSGHLSIDWLHAPFSRCLNCNHVVEIVDPLVWWPSITEVRTSAPVEVALPLTRCANCDSLHWRGGHAQRMQARLQSWSAGRFI